MKTFTFRLQDGRTVSYQGEAVEYNESIHGWEVFNGSATVAYVAENIVEGWTAEEDEPTE